MFSTAKSVLYQLGIVSRISRRRLRFIDGLYGGRLFQPQNSGLKVLEVGCHIGKDFVSFFKGRTDLDIKGLDLKDFGLRQENFEMIVGDAEHIPFSNNYFDLVIAIGVLEHIVPIEKLSMVIREINRVSHSYIVIVPSAKTLVEPHLAQVFWQIRDRNMKTPYPLGPLLHMSDDAWVQFEGFKQAETTHWKHIPPFINNLVIYKIRSIS